MAFKLKRTTVDGAVQQSNTDKVNDTATQVETSKSMEKLSGEVSEERIPESSDMKEQKSSDDMTEEKEVNTGEATDSGDKCTSDALAESGRNDDSESLSKDGKSYVKNPISREDLKAAFKKFGTVRVIIIHTIFWLLLLFVYNISNN